jgi:hypothetical protein
MASQKAKLGTRATVWIKFLMLLSALPLCHLPAFRMQSRNPTFFKWWI